MKHIREKKLSCFLDGEISEKERHYISRHLDSCMNCQKKAENLSKISHSLDLIEEAEASPYFMLKLKQKIKEREEKVIYLPLPLLEWIRSILKPVAATALIGTFLLLANYLGTYKPLNEKGEFDNFFYLTFFDNFPEGSLGKIYNYSIEGGEE